MALRPQFSLINSEFNEFLFASVGEENNGLQLTVLSALTRLGFDPWGEAARLSDLPKETATRALATAIAGLPEGHWKIADTSTIAARLVSCLPTRSAPVARSLRRESGAGRPHQMTASEIAKWLKWGLLAAAMLLAMSHVYYHQPAEPAQTTAAPSTTQR